MAPPTTQTTQSTGIFISQRTKATRSVDPKLQSASNQELLDLIKQKKLNVYNLEQTLDFERAVEIRRLVYEQKFNNEKKTSLDNIPYKHFNYSDIYGVCCENVIGYIPIPVGVVGPILIDNKQVYVPMATTEGSLIASTQRGCKAITESSGVTTVITKVGMTRAPLIRFPNVQKSHAFKQWIETPENFQTISKIYSSTSHYARLEDIQTNLVGRYVYIRFRSTTGDAMGMNMITKGVEKVLEELKESKFEDMEIMSLSSNFCTDKKSSSINWTEGRGASVIAEAIISGENVKNILKTNVEQMVELNTAKNLVGSAIAGSIGGYNAHAANIVTAIFLAAGQDPAQNVESSNCLTHMESCNDGKDLRISITMPSLEVGTVGGGTHLPAQSSVLSVMSSQGASKEYPGKNSETLARVVCSTVMAGELSLMAALSAGHLVRSHMKHNRKKEN